MNPAEEPARAQAIRCKVEELASTLERSRERAVSVACVLEM